MLKIYLFVQSHPNLKETWLLWVQSIKDLSSLVLIYQELNKDSKVLGFIL